nr:hypothetical protein CFP56_14096 [Quercus suber]
MICKEAKPNGLNRPTTKTPYPPYPQIPQSKPTIPTNQHICPSSDPRQRPLPQATNHPHANVVPFAIDLIQPIEIDPTSPVVFSSIRIKGKGNWVADYFKKQQSILEGCLGANSMSATLVKLVPRCKGMLASNSLFSRLIVFICTSRFM